MMRLEGKTALVTGGGAGIGGAIVERFVAEGAKVCVADMDAGLLDGKMRTLPAGSAVSYPGDVSNDEDAARMVATTVAFGGRIDILVNNAAMNAQGPIHELDRGTFRKVLDVNLVAPFVLMHEAIPHMIGAGGGSIINICSVGGMRSLPNMPAYCSSKAGLIMLTQQAAHDYGRYNIRCNAICPGGIKTAMTNAQLGALGESVGIPARDFYRMISSETPLARFGDPSEIAGVCAFLASEDASFVTACAIPVDAGTAVVDVVGAFISSAVRKGAGR